MNKLRGPERETYQVHLVVKEELAAFVLSCGEKVHVESLKSYDAQYDGPPSQTCEEVERLSIASGVEIVKSVTRAHIPARGKVGSE
jgi:hypothetical protein